MRQMLWLGLPLFTALFIVFVASGALQTAPARDLLAELLSTCRAIGAQFQVVNATTPLLHLFVPAGVCAAVVSLIMFLDPEARWSSRTVVIGVLAALYTIYILFRLFGTLNLSTTANATFSVLLFGAEFLAYLKSLSSLLQMLWPSDRSPAADELSGSIRRGEYLPEVDIFIPTYSEPVEILRRTILGCQSLRYSRKQIYLLDDQRRPEMRALARELGCHYRDRPDNRHAKAGNMNAAIPSTYGDLIAVFDADFIPTEDFLERTVGFFIDPAVGLVQTPQNFYSADAVSRNLGLPHIITEEQQVFFRAAQPGRDTFGAMICHGTSFIIRRSALRDIGGFPGETLSEDWATSIKLQSCGYKTCYLNELLSAGAAAEFTSEFVTQRLRWARGTLQCFFASTNPLTVPGLTFMQRLMHLCGPLHYLPFLSRLLFLLLPLIYFLFGIVPISTSLELLAVFLLPYWLCQSIALAWLTRGHRSAFWSEVYDTMLCIPMSITVISTILRPFGKPFKVSAKGETRTSLTFNPAVGLPLIALLGLYITTVAYVLFNAPWTADPSALMLPLACSFYAILVLWLSLLASLDVPQQKSAPSFGCDVHATLRQRGASREIRIIGISDSEVTIAKGTAAEILPYPKPESGSPFALSIPACGLSEVPVAPERRKKNGDLHLRFERLSIAQQRALVAYLYCQSGQWNPNGVPEPVTFWHFLKAPFRIYGLAETA